ncbi:MAG: hypothetical protein KKF44_03180 [Nanoarchaeota archaeon]|nr:hypothetical protein [Nanoarchaeota archaeon]
MTKKNISVPHSKPDIRMRQGNSILCDGSGKKMDTKNLEWLLGERVYVSETDELQSQHRKEYYEPVFQQIYGPDFQGSLDAVLLAENPDERLDQLDKALFMAFIHDEFDMKVLSEYASHLADDSLEEIKEKTEKLVSLMEYRFGAEEPLSANDINAYLSLGISLSEADHLTALRLEQRASSYSNISKLLERERKLDLLKRPKPERINANPHPRQSAYSPARASTNKRAMGLNNIELGKKWLKEMVEWYRPVIDDIFGENYFELVGPILHRKLEEDKYSVSRERLSYIDRILWAELHNPLVDSARAMKNILTIASSYDDEMQVEVNIDDFFAKNILASIDAPSTSDPEVSPYAEFIPGGMEILQSKDKPRVVVTRKMEEIVMKQPWEEGYDETGWVARIDGKDVDYDVIQRGRVLGIDAPMYQGKILTHLYDNATNNPGYNIRKLDFELMQHIVGELTKWGYYNHPEIKEKHKIYAALASGPSKHEIVEMKELFPDHLPIFVDKYFSDWKPLVEQNIKDAFEENNDDSEVPINYGHVSGDDADFLKKDANLRKKVIEAAKDADESLQGLEDDDFHIVWRLDHTAFNFDPDQQRLLFSNLNQIMQDSKDWDEFYQGVGRTPQDVATGRNMGIENDSDYSAIENNAYMMYIANIVMGLPIRKSEYFSKFVVKEYYPSSYLHGVKKNKKRAVSGRCKTKFGFDMGAKANEDITLSDRLTLPQGTELSMVFSGRPHKKEIRWIPHTMNYPHQTACNHPTSPHSILSYGRATELLRILYHVEDDGNGKSRFVTYFEENPDPIDTRTQEEIDKESLSRPPYTIFRDFTKPPVNPLNPNFRPIDPKFSVKVLEQIMDFPQNLKLGYYLPYHFTIPIDGENVAYAALYGTTSIMDPAQIFREIHRDPKQATVSTGHVDKVGYSTFYKIEPKKGGDSLKRMITLFDKNLNELSEDVLQKIDLQTIYSHMQSLRKDDLEIKNLRFYKCKYL